jgi:hypothetical protein
MNYNLALAHPGRNTEQVFSQMKAPDFKPNARTV